MDISSTINKRLQNQLSFFDNGIGRALTIVELSRIINFSQRTIYNWIHREKDFPYKKWGKAVRFYLEDVINWLEKRSEHGSL